MRFTRPAFNQWFTTECKSAIRKRLWIFGPQAAPPRAGFFIAVGNALSSRFSLMTLDTQMTLALLQEQLMALRANDADGYKSWLALGIEQLGRDVAVEVESDWMVPLLVEEERDRLMAWHLGMSL
jgi:hypothetical protein